MVKQFALAGPITRKIGYRLHSEMGLAGEEIWAKITGGQLLGRSTRFRATWKGSPPVDVIDWDRRIGYQVKVFTDPKHRVAFSGAHKNVKYAGSKKTYVGEPRDKLDRIRGWLGSQGLEGWLIVMVLDEDANRAVVFSKRGVHNATIEEMEPIGVIDNDAGVFYVPRLLRGSIEREQIPIPTYVEGLPRFPNIPKFLRSSTKGEIPPPGALGIRPLEGFKPVRVRQHKRSKRQ
jgi:hypothetical protein